MRRFWHAWFFRRHWKVAWWYAYWAADQRLAYLRKCKEQAHE